MKIVFLYSFHCARALSCSDRVVSFEAEKSELEFMKAWSYLEIIDLRPHSRHGLLTKDNSYGGGGGAELTPNDEVYTCTVLEDFFIPMDAKSLIKLPRIKGCSK